MLSNKMAQETTNNEKNSQEVILKNLGDWDFHYIRETFIAGQKRMKDKEKIKQSSNAWHKLEKAWYNGLAEDEGVEQ
jgi:hypothetical protein